MADIDNGDVIVVTDTKGRKLSIQAMDPGDQLDFFEACGKNSTNLAWINMALWACSVRAIDGVPVVMPSGPVKVKQLARQLGHHGLAAVRRGLGIDVDPEAEPEEGAAPQPSTDGVDLDVAKN